MRTKLPKNKACKFEPKPGMLMMLRGGQTIRSAVRTQFRLLVKNDQARDTWSIAYSDDDGTLQFFVESSEYVKLYYRPAEQEE